MIQPAPLALVASLLALSAGAQVVINEVLYDPPGADDGKERIELFNTGPMEVVLTGWALSINYPGPVTANRTYFPFPTGSRVAPGGLLTVHYLEDGLDTNTEIYTGSSGGAFLCFLPKPLHDSIGSVALYQTQDCSQFFNFLNLRDFVQWGGRTFHEPVAVLAGIWPVGTWVDDFPEGDSIAYDGDGDSPADYFDDRSPTIGLDNGFPGFPAVTGFGAGCPGGAGVPALSSLGGPPALGNASFTLRVDQALPSSTALFGLTFAPASLPLMGCTLLLHPVPKIIEFGPVPISPAGVGLLGLPIPDDLFLLGASAFVQAAVFDPSSPGGLLAFSDGLQLDF